MLQRIVSRLLAALFVLVGVSLVVFLLIHVIPGDPVEVMLGEHAAPADSAALRAQLGLDQSIGNQLLHYYKGLLQFDLGQSLFNRQPVSSLILERLPATLELTAAALMVAIIISIPLGILAASRRRQAWDHAATSLSMLGMSIPNFVLGPLLMLLFAVWLGLLPVSGRQGWASLILPAITLGSGLSAMLTRMLRSSLLEVLGEDYIRSARARGLSPMRVLLGHALRNAWLPVITLLGLQLGALLAGAVITETVFNWPGIGQLTIEAIQRRDYPVLQGCVLFISIVYVLVNTAVDMLYTWIDPRIRPDIRQVAR
jgi:peptide/nickel transport system permease protein